jgi:hypothetical protein
MAIYSFETRSKDPNLQKVRIPTSVLQVGQDQVNKFLDADDDD